VVNGVLKERTLNLVQSINPLHDPRWARFVQNHPRATVFHSVPWLQALYRTYRYEPIVYTTTPKWEELKNGLLFCKVQSWATGRRLVSLPFSDHCEPLVEDSKELQLLLAGSREDTKQQKWQYLEMRPLTSSFVESIEERSDQYFLHYLDLRPGVEELYKHLHVDSIRRKIQRGAREGLMLESGNTENLLNQFYRLHLMTRRRQGLPPHPKRWFRHVLELFGNGAIIRVGRKQDTPIAAVMTVESNQSIVYKYGCSDARFHNLGGMPFVFWDMIRDAKQRGFVQLDLGRSDLRNTGLITFKDRWGAVKQRLLYSRYPPRRAELSLRQKVSLQLATKICSRSPDWLLTAAGNLLYPHIG
jgi:CelD/BcsL family acetyltransferase involved in cellulose biosynthesis